MNSKNKKTKKSSIRYGNVDVPKDEFEARNVKERITIMIDQDILDKFREHAGKTGQKYQTLINKALREATLKPSLEKRIELLERKVNKLA